MSSEASRRLRTKLLGAIMRQIRHESGRSQKDVAELLGCSASSMSAYERGLKAPSLPELELFAFHMKTPLDTLLDPDTVLEDEETFDPETLLALRDGMIGALLKTHREEANLSNRALGEETQISPRRIAAFQRGKRAIPLPELESLAQALDQSLDEYIDLQGPVGQWQENQRAAQVFRKLPEDARTFLLDPDNLPYLRIAQQLSTLPFETLRAMAQELLDTSA